MPLFRPIEVISENQIEIDHDRPADVRYGKADLEDVIERESVRIDRCLNHKLIVRYGSVYYAPIPDDELVSELIDASTTSSSSGMGA